MSLVQTVHLTMGNYKSPMVVPAVQNDSDRQLKMIVDDFTLSNSMTGKMTFKRADGTFYEAEATLALADNAFVAELDQALTCPGRTLAQLKVTATDTVSTFSFIVWVEADTSGTVTPQEGISLSEAVQRAESAADRAEAAAESGGLSNDAKVALLNAVAHVAWTEANGQQYYNALLNELDVQIPCTGITLDKASISGLVMNTSSVITATVTPSNTTDPVIWSTSNPAVATVAAGVVTGVGVGSCTITATCGSMSASCTVEVVYSGVTYTATNNLTRCTTSNPATTIYENQTYVAVLTPDTGYELSDGDVTVMLGGVDVTATTFNAETNTVTVVISGNLTITAVATEQVLPTWTSAAQYVLDSSNIIEGIQINNNGNEVADANQSATDYLNCVGGYAIYYSGISGSSIYFYDKNHNYLGYFYNNKAYGMGLIPSKAAYFRTSAATSSLPNANIRVISKPTVPFTSGVQEITMSANMVVSSTGTEDWDRTRATSSYISIYGASALTPSSDLGYKYVCYYDKDKNFIYRAQNVGMGTGMVDPVFFNAAYIRFTAVDETFAENYEISLS